MGHKNEKQKLHYTKKIKTVRIRRICCAALRCLLPWALVFVLSVNSQCFKMSSRNSKSVSMNDSMTGAGSSKGKIGGPATGEV